MNNITIDEVKDILKCSIDETTNMNEVIERTLQHIYLKGWNDSEKEHNFHLKKIRDEIEEASNCCNNAVAKGCYLFCLGVINKYIYKLKEKKNIPICEKCKWAFKSCRNCDDNFNLFEPKGE